MQIRTEQEALFLACEMEAEAVQLYQRALQVMQGLGREKEPLYQSLQAMLGDEQSHLCRFRALYRGMEADDEQRLALSAMADGVLFEGGLMSAARQGLLSDVESMLRLAAKAEATSVDKYREFAEAAATPEARDALLMIANEEQGHLLELETSLD